MSDIWIKLLLYDEFVELRTSDEQKIKENAWKFYDFRSMSGQHLNNFGHQRKHSKGHSKDFTVATPEEFVRRFGGNRVINKVRRVTVVDRQEPPVVFTLEFLH